MHAHSHTARALGVRDHAVYLNILLSGYMDEMNKY